MINYGVRTIHNISRPNQPHEAGDIIEIECIGGFVKEVDPVTQKCRETHQQFKVIGKDGTLEPTTDRIWARDRKAAIEPVVNRLHIVNQAMRRYWPIRRLLHP